MKKAEPVVFVVDDESGIRHAIERLCRYAGYLVKSFESPATFLEAYDGEPGCLVLDLNMPGMDGLALQKRLKTQGIRLPILFLTGGGDVPSAVEAMKHGAMQFLQKPFENDELLQCIAEAIAADAAWRKEQQAQFEMVARLETLTQKEREVMLEIARGKASKLVAYEMGISPRTVEVHRGRVMEKLGVRNVAELVNFLVQAGQLNPDTTSTAASGTLSRS